MSPIAGPVIGSIVLLTLLLVAYREKDHIRHYIRCKRAPAEGMSGMPTPTHVLRQVARALDRLPFADYTLVDLGCGQGEFLGRAHGRFARAVGVELDPATAERARARFAGAIADKGDSKGAGKGAGKGASKSASKSADKCAVEIVTGDMTEYQFGPGPQVVYIYEPLWQMAKEDALPVYERLFDSLAAQLEPGSFVIYVSGVRPLLDRQFFARAGERRERERRFRVRERRRIARDVGYRANYLYVLAVE